MKNLGPPRHGSGFEISTFKTTIKNFCKLDWGCKNELWSSRIKVGEIGQALMSPILLRFYLDKILSFSRE